MTDYNAQMAKLSDDMVGQLFLAAQRALAERGIRLADVVRRQIRRGEVVCWLGSDEEMHYGIVKAINQKSISVIEGNKHNPEVPTGVKWNIGPSICVPLGPVKPTGLAKKELPRPAYEIQTQSQDAW